MTIRTEEELDGMRRVGQLVARTLNTMEAAVAPETALPPVVAAVVLEYHW